jgi:hypothetical protein
MRNVDGHLRQAAELALGYLGETDPLPSHPADAVIGFGVFDRTLPRFCGELYERGLARHIIFTGGFGAGTGNLGGPEADVWREELRGSHPRIPDEKIVVENRSSNTAENIRFTAELLARDYPSLAFGRGIRTALSVASPSRLRRVQLTMRQLQPAVRVIRQRPVCNFETERQLYELNGIDYFAHLLGELDRLIDYPAHGWIAAEPVPKEILAARDVLRAQLKV